MEKKNDKIKWIVTFVLIAVLLLGFIGMSVKLFQKDKPVAGNTNNSAQSGFIMSETEETGITLMSATIAEEEFTPNGVSPLAESAVTLTATITPNDATYQEVDWAVSILSLSSWVSGKNVSDYVTVAPTSDGALTATAECKQAFGEPVVITVRSRKYPELFASCICNYVKRVESVDLKLMKGKNITTTLALGDGSTYTPSATPNFSVGTVTPQITTDYVLELNSNYWSKGNTSNTAGFMYGVNVSEYRFEQSFTSTQDLIFELITPNGGMKWTNGQMLNQFIACVNKGLPDNNQAVLRVTYSVGYNGAEIESGSTKINLSFDVSNLEIAVSGVNVDTPSITW